jgi:hypothetical protein
MCVNCETCGRHILSGKTPYPNGECTDCHFKPEPGSSHSVIVHFKKCDFCKGEGAFKGIDTLAVLWDPSEEVELWTKTHCANKVICSSK